MTSTYIYIYTWQGLRIYYTFIQHNNFHDKHIYINIYTTQQLSMTKHIYINIYTTQQLSWQTHIY